MANNSVVVRTAQDLERKYNLGSLGTVKRNVEITAQGLQEIQNELSSMLNALVINLKDVLDSQSEISLWFYSGIPTTSNVPYTSWANPSDHIGDLYYDQNTGYVYQYKEVNGTKLWEINSSPDLVEAMAITNSETDTSTDHERKVFFDTPTIPYSNGDWWVKTDGSLYICQISKPSGIFEDVDFIDSSKYTDSTTQKLNEELTVLKGTVTMISENYAKFTDLATGGSTTISGDNITTGSIQSNNYIKNVSGTKIALKNGTIDTKNFKVDAEGNVTCNNATINGSAILNGGNFSVSKDGILTCAGANFKGTVTGSTINGGTINGTTVNSTSGEIGGFTLGTEEFKGKTNGIYNYSQYDLRIAMAMVMEWIMETNALKNVCDYNNDGEITSADYWNILNILNGNVDNTKSIAGTFEINSNDPKNCISIKKDGEITASIGVGGINTNMLTTQNILCSHMTGTSYDDFDGVAINGETGLITLIENGQTGTKITPSSILTPTLTQTSLEESKKNFEKYTGALEEIKKTDIYKYNLVNESDEQKKHLGFVIGKNYNYSSEITTVDKDGKEIGVDNYSMTSLCLQAIKEQQEIIEQLKQEIQTLKEG